MRRGIKGSEYSAPPPEKYGTGAELSPTPELEFAALPPEYGQGTAPTEEERKRSRFLRSMLIIPLLMLLLSLFFGTGTKTGTAGQTDPAGPAGPAGQTEPSGPAGSSSPAESTAPEQTAEPDSGRLETWAELTPLGGGRVEFTAHLKPQGDADPDLQTWFFGQNCYFEGDVQHFSLMDDPKSVPVEQDPAGGWLVRYTGGSMIDGMPDGAELAIYVGVKDRKTDEIYEIESNRVTRPAEPRVSAVLDLYRGGLAEFTADITIPPEDENDYDLSVRQLELRTLLPGEEGESFPLGDDPAELPVTGDAEAGYQVHYMGPSAAASLEGNIYCYGYIELEDKNTGKTYEAETEGVYLMDAMNNLPTFPLEGNVVITVYNDTLTFDVPSPVENEDYLTLLAVDAFSMEEFTEYQLPEPIAPAGYDFLGWVVHVNNPFDYGSEENLFEIYEGDPPVDILTTPDRYAFPVENTLTREDLARVPPDEEGNRFVNVHAVWVRRDPGEPLLFLDDGMGNVTSYGMDVPLASEGYLYLCRYPVPEREDWVFTGWYDADGNRVDLLVCYFSFTPLQYNEAGDFLGYDWNRSQPVYLYAGWRPA